MLIINPFIEGFDLISKILFQGDIASFICYSCKSLCFSGASLFYYVNNTFNGACLNGAEYYGADE
jgi:hypothetical protein